MPAWGSRRWVLLDGRRAGVDEGDGDAAGSRGIVQSENRGVRRDALDKAGQDLSGPDLDERRDSVGGHPLDGSDPVHAAGQVLDEFASGGCGAGDRPRIRVG